jgi:hypothetical protein
MTRMRAAGKLPVKTALFARATSFPCSCMAFPRSRSRQSLAR